MNQLLKYSILWFSFLICTSTSQAQIIMSNGTTSTCNNSFFDSGGTSGQYGNNENLTYTICSDNTSGDTHVSIVFDPLALAAGEVLCFYDGDNTSAPLIFCNDVIPDQAFVVQASAINPSGCVTITFTSDGADTDLGWSATVNCVQQCQTVNSVIVSSSPPISPPDTGYIDLCPGDLVTFNGAGLYPQNNFIYAQSDNTSTFEWDFGDGTIGYGPNVQHPYPNPGGYIVQLTVTDVNGCVNTNFISQRIRVSGPPAFNLAEDLAPVICVNDTINIYTAVNDTLADIAIIPGTGGFQAGGTVADSVCVPDGTGETYYSSLELLDFSPGQTLNNINDLLGICVDMEHSFLGDLEIIITCPSGQSVTLHNFSNFSGGGYWLGNPIDNNAQACQSDANIGTGETYCWTPDATNGTWLQSAGLVVANQLPPGDYSSFQDLNGLLGCTLNGQWTISIEDFWGIDDGVIFSWNLSLNEDIFPNLETYDLNIVNAEWLADPSILINTPDSMVASPQYPGNINYVFEATDNFGCVYDTSVSVIVLPQTDPACYNCSGNLTPMADVTICNDGENTPLTTSLENVELTSTTFQGTSNATFGNGTHPPAAPLLSTINVAGLPYNFIDANSIQSVCINSTQFNSYEVMATLIAPNGTSMVLTNGGGAFQSNFIETCFTPLATDALTTGTAPYTGDWMPEGDFNNLNGSQANGTWTLAIADQFPGFDSNTLQNWNITFSLANDLTYSWSPSGGLTCDDCPNPVAQPTATTTYNVSATDSYGCLFTESVTITVIDCNIPCNLDATLTNSTDASCSGASDGTAEITVTGQIGSVSYVLDGTITQVDDGVFTGLSDGSHQVILTDANNCIFTVDFTINTPNPMMLTLNPTNISCSGSSDGSISSTVSGGDNNYSYSWSNGPSTSDLNNLPAGVYTVTVTDGNNCSITDMVIVSELNPILITLDSIPVNCFGEATGSALASVTGGAGNYTFIWSNSQITNPAINLAADIYTVTVTDGSNCTATQSIEVTQPTAALQITSLTQTLIPCANENLAEATVITTGGTGNYTYAWTSGGILDIETNLSPGTYTVIITDENNCTTSQSINIIEYPLLQSSISGTNINCNGDSDGTATAIGIGGSNAYTYLWNDLNAQSNATATGLTIGTYTVTITDTNNCSVTNSIILTEPVAFSQSEVITHIPCFGGTNGSIVSYQVGGSAPYQYNWSTGYNDSSSDSTFISNLGAGTYTITITDDNGCSSTKEFDINEPSIIDLTLSGTDVNCIGGNDGSASVVATGGTPPYTYLWSDPAVQITDSAVGLTANTYTIIVTDGNLCTAEESIVIGEPSTGVQILSVIQTDTACIGENLGIAVVTATGGTGSYTYIWSSGGMSDTETNLSSGTYTVTISDGNACTISQSVDIFEHSQIIPSITGTDINCNAASDGTATASATGGSGIYTYLWNDSNAQTSPTAVGLDAGSYIVTITDSNSCSASSTITLLEPAPITQTEIITDVLCSGESNGSIISYQTGGLSPYQYVWSSGYTGPSADSTHITNLGVGIYTVTITDGNGCTISREFTMNEPNPLNLNFSGTNINCLGGNDGDITVVVTGGTTPYNYLWSDSSAQNTATASNLTAGTYTVTITDNNLCTISNSFTITEPATGIQITSISQTFIGCNGSNLGEAEVIVTGGTGLYTYNWSSGATTAVATDLNPMTHTVTVTDANNCSITQTVNIVEYAAMTATAVATDVSCFDGNNGTASVTLISGGGGTGNLADYTYVWSGTSQTDANVTGLSIGTHTVTITDMEGCNTTVNLDITSPTELTSSTETSITGCSDATNGVAIVTGYGGTPPYTYEWDAGAGGATTDTITGLVPGGYNVTVTDANNCSTFSLAYIPQIQAITIGFDVTPLSCNGINDGSATVNVTGGVPPFTYTWSTGTTSANNYIGSLWLGSHTVTVTDANGCEAVAETTISGPDELIFDVDVIDVTCNGDRDGSILLTGSGGIYPYTYSFDGVEFTGTNYMGGLSAGYYNVAVQDSNGCITELDSVLITEPLPLEAIIYPSDDIIELSLGDTIDLTGDFANGQGDVFFVWDALYDDATLSCDSCQFTTINTYENDRYTLTVTDENGCIDTEDIEINVSRNREIFVPGGFTPNGDNINDVLMVHGQTGTKVRTFRVYDRWGELMFRADRYDINSTESAHTWNGEMKGKPMNPGVFVWYLEVVHIDGRKESLEGNTSLLR